MMRGRPWAVGAVAAGLTALLHFAAFPPWDVAEAAYVFALPVLLWAMSRPARRPYWVCVLAASWLTWFLLLIWLRHVYAPWGLVGGVILSGLLAVFPFAWFCLARWLLPPCSMASLGARVLTLGGLSGAWIILEWLRTWVLTGFPWLPLAASQWRRPAMLQTAEFGGQYAVSFILIFFNLALALYVWRLFIEPSRGDASAEASSPAAGPRIQLRWRFCPEFYLALAMVFGSVWVYLGSLSRASEREPLLNVAVVQPWIPAALKWDEAMFYEILDVLAAQNERASLFEPKPDLILWPEAATPLPMVAIEDRGMGAWVEARVAEAGTPLITGALGEYESGWVNAMYAVDPETGLREEYYAKRRRVPFGEYIPLRDVLFFVGTVVPLDIDLRPGEHSRPLPVTVDGETLQAGPLICYEDIFARLGREVVRAGADFIVVVTNDGWYGEEAGAYQHAAHATLRAVETRRPVVRCGNHGWSGWIDEYGNVRDVLTGADGLVYTRDSKLFMVSADPGWQGELTLYARWGDWLLWLGGVLLGGAIFWRKRPGKPAA